VVQLFTKLLQGKHPFFHMTGVVSNGQSSLAKVTNKGLLLHLCPMPEYAQLMEVSDVHCPKETRIRGLRKGP
jgi:hypothetical protein